MRYRQIVEEKSLFVVSSWRLIYSGYQTEQPNCARLVKKCNQTERFRRIVIDSSWKHCSETITSQTLMESGKNGSSNVIGICADVFFMST